MKITVQIFQGTEQVLSKVLDDGVYRIGRSDFSDIVLPSDKVSRSHLELRVTESAVYMTNMTTAGKVKVNGKSTETAEIADGDELSVGPYRVVVFHGERQEEEAAAPQEPDMGEAPAENPEGGGDFNQEAQGGENPFGNQDEAAEPPPQEDAPAEEGAAVLDFQNPQDAAIPDFQPENAFRTEGTAALRAETVVEMKPVVAKLIFSEGPRAGEELFLETYEVTFGRSKKADIFLDDEKLSRLHAKITRVGMGYRLVDMNSRNGTYVNGVRILEHPLSSFDQIEIGNSKIKFLVHDIISDQRAGGPLVAGGKTDPPSPVEETKSLQLDPNDEELRAVLQRTEPNRGPSQLNTRFPNENQQGLSGRTKLLLGLIGGLIVVLLLLPSAKDKTKVEAPSADKKVADSAKLSPLMPKEYAELSPEIQRMIEGRYNSAIKAADQEKYSDAVAQLKKIHEVLPYYKNSRDLYDQYMRKVKEKQILEAQEKAKRDEKEDLQAYLEDGKEYLKEGDFDRAAESFNSAIVIDPNNPLAIRGLKAAEYKVRDMDKIPSERDPEKEKRKAVADLFQKAVAAFSNKSYQEAIDTAEKIRQIELKGDTQYLNEAKQIIDRSRMLQKEEFEPFLIQAKEKFAEGDYNASRDLCEEMIKRDAAYEEAKECVLKAKKQLNRLAKEAYTHGYILESMNRLEEAKQYWNRARNYVRPGDDYYDKVVKKLDYYQ